MGQITEFGLWAGGKILQGAGGELQGLLIMGLLIYAITGFLSRSVESIGIHLEKRPANCLIYGAVWMGTMYVLVWLLRKIVPIPRGVSIHNPIAPLLVTLIVGLLILSFCAFLVGISGLSFRLGKEIWKYLPQLGPVQPAIQSVAGFLLIWLLWHLPVVGPVAAKLTNALCLGAVVDIWRNAEEEAQ
ncbi:MAG: hypothetical protein HYU64_20395 [Armatimonadetes bacterium]|nr:hypothetical protein [Armatimonadota bacterium]